MYWNNSPRYSNSNQIIVSAQTSALINGSGSCLLLKGVNIQKNHVLMFYPIKNNSVDEHQPFQPQMITKLVSIE